MTSWLNLFLIACRTSSYPLFRTSSQKNPIILKISRVESSAQKSCLISWNHNFLHNQLNYINWMFKIFRWRLNLFTHRVKTKTFQRKNGFITRRRRNVEQFLCPMWPRVQNGSRYVNLHGIILSSKLFCLRTVFQVRFQVWKFLSKSVRKIIQILGHLTTMKFMNLNLKSIVNKIINCFMLLNVPLVVILYLAKL